MFGLFKKQDSQDQPAKPGWTEKLKAGLARTRATLNTPVTELFRSHPKIDEEFYEELETILLMADVGVDATGHLLGELRQKVKKDGIASAEEVRQALGESLAELVAPLEARLEVEHTKPFVIMLAGVNGSGKTTTIGKLAHHFQEKLGKSVLLAAGDTFRAAAREQLQIWGSRNNVTVIAQEGNDPAAVMFDAIQSAKAKNIDIVLADTAGRLPTQLHLMEELKKIKRVMAKADPTAPHEVLLVLDANNGQNALAQVKAFDDALGVTGLILTKMDGTAKGGVVAAIARARPVPIRFIGVGEGVGDIEPFVAEAFAAAVFGDEG